MHSRMDTAPAHERDWGRILELCVAEVRRGLGTHRDAEDIAQEAFIRAWRHCDAVNDPAAFERWVRVIARREIARAWSRSAHSTEPREPEFFEATAGSADDPAEQRRFSDVVSGLPERHVQFLVLRYVGDLRHEEIARSLDISVSAAKVRLHRAHHRVRQALRD